ncbi:hypothetical protein C9374_008069 [Naegleria lovaniensis]|uniref:F-box domain-containing protein n=1 Tax=Naegleria lovaniensis TaxID=51637 RepID=A0AA88KG87_NAELO|nr:uncharacterized protein C9374_008069 [Naegleria lovaniensis]KAG2378430.1 hypothetical protein C9374_008069 [Naegleria lovaniensis]
MSSPPFFPDDILFHIFQFFDSPFIINVCMKVSHQWFRQSCDMELKLDFSESLRGGKIISSSAPCGLIQSSNFSKLTELNLANNFLGSEGAKVIAACPNMTNLKVLNIEKTAVGYDDGLLSLLQSPYIVNLTSLNISGHCMQDAIAEMVSQSENLKNVKYLFLRDCAIGTLGFNYLLSSNHLANLLCLDVSKNQVGAEWSDEEDIQDDEKTPLEFGACLKNLTQLDLHRNQLDDFVVKLLFSKGDTSRFASLNVLDLSFNSVGTEGMNAIFSNPFMKNLTCFKCLSRNEIVIENCSAASNLSTIHVKLTKGNDGLKELTSFKKLENLILRNISGFGVEFLSGCAELLTNVTYLDLSNGRIPPESFEKFAECKYTTNIRELILDSTEIKGVVALQHICESQYLTNLTSLNLSATRVNDDCMYAFINSSFRLRTLELNDCGITAIGAKTLASCKSMNNLAELRITHNNIGIDGAVELAKSENLSNLTLLEADSTSIGNDGFTAIVSSPYMKNLKTLHVQLNGIQSDGAKHLASSSYLNQLTYLDLSYNNIEDEGIIHLSESPNISNVKSLMLCINNIGVLGAKAMASSPFFSNVTYLDLDGSGIGDHESKGLRSNQFADEGAMALASSPYFEKLTLLNLSDNQVGGKDVNDEDAEFIANCPELMRFHSLLLTYNMMTDKGRDYLMNSSYFTYLSCGSFSGSKYMED